MRKVAALQLAVPMLLLSACAPSISGAIDGARTASGLIQVGKIFNNFSEARKVEIPLAGTYRLTYSFPNERPVTVFVRTLRNANVPIAVDRNSADPGSLRYSGDKVTFDGYMVNVLGATSLAAIPDSLGAAYAKGATPPELGGFLIVTEPLGKDQMGRDQYVGTFMVAARQDASGEAGRLHGLMSKAQTEFEEYEKRKHEEARREARKDRFKPWKRKNQTAEEWNAFAAIKSVIPMGQDGTVKGRVVYGIEGVEKMRVDFERVSLEAYRIPAENLDAPSVGELFRGYRDAATGRAKGKDD